MVCRALPPLLTETERERVCFACYLRKVNEKPWIERDPPSIQPFLSEVLYFVQSFIRCSHESHTATFLKHLPTTCNDFSHAHIRSYCCWLGRSFWTLLTTWYKQDTGWSTAQVCQEWPVKLSKWNKMTTCSTHIKAGQFVTCQTSMGIPASSVLWTCAHCHGISSTSFPD